MNPSYSINQLKQAEKDVIDVYKLAEERIKLSPIPCSLVQLRNAFQVFRYAFREWAMGKKEGVVLRALMLADARAKEVRSVFGAEENVIYCEDSDAALVIERLLKIDGYEDLHDGMSRRL
jgi:hypothetical protein